MVWATSRGRQRRGLTPLLNISYSRHLELPAERREQLEAAADTEFGHIELVRQNYWAEPDWSFLALEGDELVAFYNIIERTVRIDGVSVRVAGVNNVITLPAHRGRGMASRLLKETQTHWFDSLGAECGLLLCADALLAFYSRLNWQRSRVPVTYAQRDGQRTWAANCMFLDPTGKVVPTHEIDLCGLPW